MKFIEKIQTIIFNISIFANRNFHEIKWKNMLDADRLNMTIERMRILRCITKTKDTHLDYEILIAFPRQKLLLERTSKIR